MGICPVVALADKIDRLSIPEPNSGCWIWMGTVYKHGYGIVKVNGKRERAHRASYMAFHGDPGSLFVCHRCDMPLCVNPEHLFLGTAADNTADAVAKGRMARAERHGSSTHPSSVRRGEDINNAILTEELARQILALSNQGVSSAEIARRLSVSHMAVWRVVKGKTWRHIQVSR